MDNTKGFIHIFLNTVTESLMPVLSFGIRSLLLMYKALLLKEVSCIREGLSFTINIRDINTY